MNTETFAGASIAVRDVREVAKQFQRKNIVVVPVPYGEKAARIPGWTKRTLTDQDMGALDRDFPEGKPMNVGILLGTPSGNLIDVDLDCAEARDLADLLLPDTGWVFGRESARRAHYLYKVDRPVRRSTFEDPTASDGDRSMLLEIRGDGHQTIAPPSILP